MTQEYFNDMSSDLIMQSSEFIQNNTQFIQYENDMGLLNN